ncbi:RF-1 domain-containing protein [Mariannaea sp. PMI_226]|nr:RF-1 domain-containing protein [Mariannaea sp. PMI_226]
MVSSNMFRIICQSPLARTCPRPSTSVSFHAVFSTSPAVLVKAMPSRPKAPPESEIEEFYIKGSGPGGQKINKTNSAVQLRHTPTGIVVKSQATRSREQNRKHARELLAQRVDELKNGDQSRSAIVGMVKQKRAASASKKSRRKYKKLEEEKQTADNVSGAQSISKVEYETPQGDQDIPTTKSKLQPTITIQRV